MYSLPKPTCQEQKYWQPLSYFGFGHLIVDVFIIIYEDMVFLVLHLLSFSRKSYILKTSESQKCIFWMGKVFQIYEDSSYSKLKTVANILFQGKKIG